MKLEYKLTWAINLKRFSTLLSFLTFFEICCDGLGDPFISEKIIGLRADVSLLHGFKR